MYVFRLWGVEVRILLHCCWVMVQTLLSHLVLVSQQRRWHSVCSVQISSLSSTVTSVGKTIELLYSLRWWRRSYFCYFCISMCSCTSQKVTHGWIFTRFSGLIDLKRMTKLLDFENRDPWGILDPNICLRATQFGMVSHVWEWKVCRESATPTMQMAMVWGGAVSEGWQEAGDPPRNVHPGAFSGQR